MTVAHMLTDPVHWKSQLYRTTAFMALSAILTSAALITYFSNAEMASSGTAATNPLHIGVVTLMPYMISAVIAAITAIAAMTIIPAAQFGESTSRIMQGLNEVQAGDLTARVRLSSNDQLKEAGNSFNSAVSELSNSIAQWKVIDRQQWGALCRIRAAVESNHPEEALQFVEEMERNWDKIAEIENRLIT
ncbi:MAG: hypothetical protein KKA42_05220 [candidate division Zixibacteria bacterium]|nr:hypothetical protein [candidate division Zixibacteria bacterium]